MSVQATPLDFEFRGYSVWLELEQIHSDLDKAIQAAAVALDVHEIPAPHVTAIYGIDHLSEDEILQRFRNDLAPRLTRWPVLHTKGFRVDVSLDGVAGQEMDMAWMEVEFETSENHEDLVDTVYETFYNKDDLRLRPWTPHLSIAYENPSIAKVDLPFAVKFMEEFPALSSQPTRTVAGVALWRTKGRMEDWMCLDRFDLTKPEEST